MFDCCPGQPFQQDNFSRILLEGCTLPHNTGDPPWASLQRLSAGGWEDHWTMESTIVRSFRVLGGEMIIHPTKLHEFEAAQKEQPGIFKRLAAAGEETLEDRSNLLSKSSTVSLTWAIQKSKI